MFCDIEYTEAMNIWSIGTTIDVCEHCDEYVRSWHLSGFDLVRLR